MPHVIVSSAHKDDTLKIKSLMEALPEIVAGALYPDDSAEENLKKIKVDFIQPEMQVNGFPIAIRIFAGYALGRNSEDLPRIIREIKKGLGPIKARLFPDLKGKEDFFIKVTLSDTEFDYV